MVQRENRNNAFAKFGGQTKSIMVFSEMAFRGCNFHMCFKFGWNIAGLADHISDISQPVSKLCTFLKPWEWGLFSKKKF